MGMKKQIKNTIKKTEKISETDGMPIEEIASNFKLPINRVLKELKSIGIKKKSGSDILSDKEFDLIVSHLEAIIKNENLKKENGLVKKEIFISPPITVKNIAELLGKKPSEIIMKLMKFNILASINQVIDFKVAEKLALSFNVFLKLEEPKKVVNRENIVSEVKKHNNNKMLKSRPPVVTFMGHVDHGKTSIQDAIRKTNVVKKEAGGITQHTGASVIQYKNNDIIFIDTPGHEAFTEMRARGANVTDIVVLVVAADDGFMPQTIEALSHAKAAGVPIIVAINKIDLPGANPDKVLLHMQQNGLMSEDWGGEVGTVKVSAITGEGLNDLLDRILLEAELLELKADINCLAEGVVLESQLEIGVGAVANVLVKNGILKVGDIVLSEHYFGKVKSLIDSHGKRLKSVQPGYPVKLVGLSGLPRAGAIFNVCNSEKEASNIAEKRFEESRIKELSKVSPTSLENLFSKNDDKVKALKLIIKTDVQGTGEAIRDSLNKFPNDKIKINIIYNAVGSITENDVMLASASNAIIVGFHVKADNKIRDLAKSNGVEIRLYTVIYELIEDMKDALEGRLAPEEREKYYGKARILRIFNVSKGPKVCGCIVEDGFIKVGAKARVYRNKDLIFNGVITSLRRFQDNVIEVKNGNECGIKLNNFLDFQENDIIEVYDIELKKACL